MYNKRRAVSFVLVLALIASFALSACGGKATPAPTQVSPTKAPATKAPEPTKAPATKAPEPTKAPATKAPKPAEKITLVYWAMWHEEEPQGQVVKRAIEAYEADHPNVTIKVTWYGRDVKKLIGPALAAGKKIDLFEVQVPDAKAHALNLKEYLKKPALGKGNKEMDISVYDSIFPALWTSVDALDSKGNIVGVPYQPYVVMVFYNKDHFKKANITKAPQTWDDFIAAAKALKGAGFEPFTEDLDAYTDIMLSAFAERAVTCPGINEVVKDPTAKKWEDPNLKMMAEKVAEFSKYLAKGTEGNLYPAGQQRVALGEVSMNLNGSWLPSELKKLTPPDFQWGQFPFPALPGGKGSTTHVESGAQTIGLNKDCEHPDEAFDFIRYLAGYESQTDMTKNGSNPAARMDVPWPAPLSDAFAYFKTADQSLSWACGLYDTGEIFANVVEPNFKSLLLGKLTPEEYIQKMEKEQKEFWATHKQ